MKATSQTLLLLSTSPQPVASQATATDVLESTPNDLPLIKITSMLPQSVQAALAHTFRQESLHMANDGGKFNATDFVDRRYPMRRLIFAAVTGDKCLVHYEKGGYSHNYYALIFRVDHHQNAKLIWSASYREKARNISALKAAARSAIQDSWNL